MTRSTGPAGPATIYEVAARAGVSITTVSHALNRPDRVAETTRLRVVEAADALGFAGRRRARAAVQRIAIVGPFSRHPSYLGRLAGVLQSAAGEYDTIVVDDARGVEAPVIDELGFTSRVDGLILMGAEPTPALAAALHAQGIVTVLLDRHSDVYSTVTIDDEAGGRLIAEHVVQTGARTVAWLSPPPPPGRFITGGELRLRGLGEGLRKVDPGWPLRWLVSDPGAGGPAALIAELAPQELPDTIVAHDDGLAAEVIRALEDRGTRVPEEVQVIGYDDGPVATAMRVTTVHQPFAESGRVAFRLLRDQLRSSDPAIAHISLPPQLLVRSTTRAVDA